MTKKQEKEYKALGDERDRWKELSIVLMKKIGVPFHKEEHPEILIHKVKESNDNRPIGSGVLTLVFGIIFICAGAIILIWKKTLDFIKENLLTTFLLVNGFLLIIWSFQRFRQEYSKWDVGRDTIRFVMALVSTLLAIIALKG